MFPVSSSRLQKTSSAGVCDIIVPVFNRPDMVRDLFQSLTAHTNRALLGHMWVGDDASDDMTSDVLRTLARTSGLPVTVVRREKNFGFAENCNDLFSRCTAKHVVLLNTDVVVPPFWLERLLQAFDHDERIALATPYATKAATHTLRLQAGQNWMDADRLLAGRTPQFPDDCTAIGFCMAIDKEKLMQAGVPLFDAAFGRGYGEDTDLHYRVLQAGLRSVIVDHLLVFHAGSSSFSALPDFERIRDDGQQLAWSRWADVHVREYARFEEAGTLAQVMDPATHVCTFQMPRRSLDVLFVLPNSFVRYGGVWFVCKFIEHLTSRGYAAAVYVQDNNDLYSDLSSFGFRAFADEQDLRASISSVGCVFATSHSTIVQASSFADEFACPHAIFLQNMEVCFRSGCSIDTYRAYKKADRVLTVSQALTDYIRLFQPAADVHTLGIGPDPLTFYPHAVERQPKTIAIAVNDIPEKGFTHALEMALLLKDRGFSLTFFGWDVARMSVPEDIGTVLQDTGRTALAKLFSRTEFLIDHSYLEGLGLPPLEAAFCGCVPIVASKGAPEYLFEDGKNAIRLKGYKTLGATLDRIASLSQGNIAQLRKNALLLRDRFTLQRGYDGLEAALEAWGTRKPRAVSDFPGYALQPR